MVAGSNLSSLVSEAVRSVYERDGIVVLRNAFDDAWVECMREAFEKAMAAPGPHSENYAAADGGGRFFADVEIALRLPEFDRFIRKSPAAEIAGRIMASSEIRYFDDHLLMKEPGTTKTSPWHQDQPYWAVSGRQVCTVWLPLDHIAENVSVEFVRGSHRWEAFNPLHFGDDSPYEGTGLPPMPDIDAEREQYDIVGFAMEPGDCLVFHAMIVHGAPGNFGASRRRAIATRWAGDDARYCVRPGEISIPVDLPAGLTDGDVLAHERFPVVWSAPRRAIADGKD